MYVDASKHPKYVCEDLSNSQCYRLHIPLNYTDIQSNQQIDHYKKV